MVYVKDKIAALQTQKLDHAKPDIQLKTCLNNVWAGREGQMYYVSSFTLNCGRLFPSDPRPSTRLRPQQSKSPFSTDEVENSESREINMTTHGPLIPPLPCLWSGPPLFILKTRRNHQLHLYPLHVFKNLTRISKCNIEPKPWVQL